jgi:single-strand DNA-binding protein
LIGRLTSDPEARSLQSGQTLCSLRLAYNSSERDGNGWKDKGNFVNVTVWGAHGETCAKFLSKGSRIALKGRLSWREWEGEGGKRSETSIIADRVQFLDPPKEGATQPSHQATAPVDNDPVPF